MIEYTKDGLVTDEPQIAVMFVGKEILSRPGCGAILVNVCKDGITVGDDTAWTDSGRVVCIPWPLVHEAIQPVEGEGFIVDSDVLVLHSQLIVHAADRWNEVADGIIKYHKRVLNIITTRAELRELVRWAKGE